MTTEEDSPAESARDAKTALLPVLAYATIFATKRAILTAQRIMVMTMTCWALPFMRDMLEIQERQITQRSETYCISSVQFYGYSHCQIRPVKALWPDDLRSSLIHICWVQFFRGTSMEKGG